MQLPPGLAGGQGIAQSALGDDTDDPPATAVAPATGTGDAPLAPALDSSLEGYNFDTDHAVVGTYYFIPPDPNGAVGPNQLVSLVNSAIDWRNKDGTAIHQQGLGLQAGSSAGSFFASLGPVNGLFDARVVYDSHADRFVVAALELRDTARGDSTNSSRILVAVSDDNDPNGTWHFAAIDSKITIGSTSTWADFPGLAVDEEAVYITANMFSFGSAPAFQGERLWIIDKSPLYSGAAAAVTVNNPFGAVGLGAGFTAMPAMILGAGGISGATGTFLVSAGWTQGPNERLSVIRVDNPLGAVSFSNQFINLGNIDSGGGSFPAAPQLGSSRTIDVGDSRVQNAVWRDGSLYAVNTVRPPSGADSGQPTAHWYRISTASLSSLSLADQGNVGGEDIAAGTRTFYPAIAVDAKDNVAITFAASGSAIYPGAYYTVRKATDPAGTVEPSSALAAGQDFYYRAFGGSENRWGDFSSVVVDPAADMTFYAFGEYALPRGTILSQFPTEDGRWGTRWGSFTLNAAPTASAGGPYTIDEGQSLGLTASASDPDPGDTLTYSWDVNGDLVFGDATGPAPTLTWAQLGALAIVDGPSTRNVRVRVTDNHGASTDSAAVLLTVNNVPVTAVFTGGGPVTDGSPGLVSFGSEFDPSSADTAAGFTYSFDFNDDGDFADADEIAGSASSSATVPAAYLTGLPSRTVRGRISDKDGGFTDYTTTITINPATGPRVVRVEVGSSAWNATFRDQLVAGGLGTQDGYAVPAGAEQLKSLPWTALDQIAIQFDEGVDVQSDDLVAGGVNVPAFAIGGFQYDAATFTATWTLPQSIGQDVVTLRLDGLSATGVQNAAGHLLDGEWTNQVSSYPSGNGTAGGDFVFQFDVLPADYNQDNIVDVSDVQMVATNWLAASPLADGNGDGIVDVSDLQLIAAYWLNANPGAGGGSMVAGARAVQDSTFVAATPTDTSGSSARDLAIALTRALDAAIAVLDESDLWTGDVFSSAVHQRIRGAARVDALLSGDPSRPPFEASIDELAIAILRHGRPFGGPTDAFAGAGPG